MIDSLKETTLQNRNIFFFFTSILLCVSANIHDLSWWYNYDRFIDPWMYWGTAQNFEYYEYHFGDTYYFRRWTSTFPVYLSQLFFSAGTAKFLLANFTLFVSLFLILKICEKIFLDRVTGIFVCIIFILTDYLLYAVQMLHVTYISLIIGLFSLYFLIKFIEDGSIIRIDKIFFIFFISMLLLISFPFFGWLSGAFAGTIYFINVLKFNKNFIKEFILISALYLSALFLVLSLDILVGMLFDREWQNILSYSLNIGAGFQADDSAWRSTFGKFNPKAFTLPTMQWSYIYMSLIIFYFFNLGKIKYENRALNAFAILILFTFILYFGVSLIRDPIKIVTDHAALFLHLFLIMAIPFYVYNFKERSKIIIYLVCIVFALSSHTYFNQINERIIFGLLLIAISLFIIFIRKLSIKKLNKIKVIFISVSSILLLFFATGIFAHVKKSYTREFAIFHFDVLSKDVRDNLVSERMFPINLKKIEELDQLSFEIKDLTKFNGKYYVWVQDNREYIGWSPLVSSLYGFYGSLTPANLGVKAKCNHLWFMNNKPNSVLVVFGHESSEESLMAINEISDHCQNTKFIPVDLGFKVGYSFLLEEYE